MMMPRLRIAALLPLLFLLPSAHPQAAIQAEQQTNCPVNAISHSRDCTLAVFLFDRPADNPHTQENARHTTLTATGPGLSLGNAGGWRIQHLDLDYLNVATRGISQGRTLFLTKHAAGDTMGTYDYVYTDGGSTAQSDEALKGSALDVGETNGYFHGTLASTTGTGDVQPVLKFVSGNNWTTDGAPLLDITQGKIAGTLTGRSSPLPGSGYLNTLPVDNVLPLSTAWGICETAIPSNRTAQVNIPFTCNVTLKQGRFRPEGLVCVTGPSYPEQAPITAASEPSGGKQTITLSLRNPNGPYASIFQGGLCGQYLSFDANLTATGYRSSYYAFGALDPHHLIYGMVMRNGLAGNTLPMEGSEAEQAGVPGFNGYHLYPGCEVVTNRTFGAAPICEPNAVPWATGDTIEAPHNVAVNMVGHFTDLVQNTPANGGISSGDLLQFHGPGTSSRNFAAHRTRNGNPTSLYRPFGGPFTAPNLYANEGYYDMLFGVDYIPRVVIGIGNRAGKTEPFTLFELPGGNIRWDPVSGTLLARTSLHGITTIIGGQPLALGTCATGTATIPGAAKTMIPVTVASNTGAPGFGPSGAFQVNAQVTAANTVTVNVCAILPGTPIASTYLVSLQ